MARMISTETPLMHEIHAIESVYGSILNAPDDDPHLLAAHKIANGGRTDA
ncbi:hypothetical protein ACFQ5J_05410 [Lacticaseibacillus baoqingensis]|uniref:Uncharacterized protein n=1 Tax=Lacticaseibacillus baoqingensis TaxID=2486013 RepID=A0ABW4E5K1_9LACO|nr:hypothetical protein [Lacticaseibacillus baoqingensis]